MKIPSLKSLILSAFLISGSFCQNLRTNDQSVIVNGNFQNPVINSATYQIPQAFGWFDRLSDKITIGKGNQLNSLWPTQSQVLVLKKNNRIYQSLALTEHDYQLQLQYSLSINSILSSYNFTTDFRIYWNDVQIYHINPTSSAVFSIKTRVKSIYGTNTLEFVGNGQQDCDDVQILIDNVNLFQIVQQTQKERQVYTLISRTGFWTSTEVMINKDDGRIHNNPILSYSNPAQVCTWVPRTPTMIGNWIQIYRLEPTLFVAFETQGRTQDTTNKPYIKSYKVSYTLDGINWKFVQNGRIFAGNYDSITRVRVNFAQPILANSLRFHPIQWQTYIGLRIDSIYLKPL